MTARPESRLQADYVIVGGGSAGCVLANRLSEDPSVEVLLLEAGGEAGSLLVQIPAGFAKLVGHPTFDWAYSQAPDPTIDGRSLVFSAGRLLGGGSSINGQVYIQGSRRDFDRWAEMGATGWSYADVRPYFQRSEGWRGAPDQNHGAHGPLSVSPMKDPHPLARRFVQACGEFGLPVLEDYNDGEMDGAFLSVATQRDGLRCSAEKAYLRPARGRPNLRVITGAEASKVTFDGRRATGVDFRTTGGTGHAGARREVIVSAGAMGSPALLMRSGVGCAERLRDAGIAIVHDLPAVGENLQDHATISIHKFVNRPTFNTEMSPLRLLGHLARFVWNRTGLLAPPVVQAMALARTHEALEAPDVQLHFTPASFLVGPDGAAVITPEPALTIVATICHPHSRGRIDLGDDGRPRVIHRFFDDERDLDTLVDAAQMIERLYQTPTFKALVVGDKTPHPIPEDREAWRAYVRAHATVCWHTAGTCRMGSDAASVVDPELRVRGLTGLRVVDASIMPGLTSANTNATVMMIAEKASDIILER